MNVNGKVFMQRRRAFFDTLCGMLVALKLKVVETALHAYFLPVP